MGDFSTYKLAELAEIVTGSTPAADEADSWGDEIDFITPTDQTGARDVKPARRLSSVGAQRLQSRIVPAYSVNLTCIGSTIGKVSMARAPSVTNQQINSLIARRNVVHPVFLYYLVRDWSPTLRREASGSTTPIVNKSALGEYEFRVPSEEYQRAIVEVLGALDDKIAANAKLLASLEGLSAASFSALPKDDRIPLSSVAQFVNGKAFTKGASGTDRVVVRIAELNSGIGGSTVYNDLEVPDQHLARPGDILFAWSGSLTLHRWYRDEAIVNQHIFKVIPNEGRPHWLVWGLIGNKLAEFRAIAADKATTMGHIQRRHLDELVPVPSPDVVAAHDDMMTAVWHRALAAERENLALAATRDALLPGLMSGKLRVREDAERMVQSHA